MMQVVRHWNMWPREVIEPIRENIQGQVGKVFEPPDLVCVHPCDRAFFLHDL